MSVKSSHREVFYKQVLPCSCSATVIKFPEKIHVKGLPFTKVPSLQPATLLKIPGNEFSEDICNNNGTSCFIE